MQKRRKKLRQLILTSYGTDEDGNENHWKLTRVHNSKEAAPSIVEKPRKKKRKKIKLHQLELPLESRHLSGVGDYDEELPLLRDVRSKNSPPPTAFSLLRQTLRRNVRGETPLHIAAIKVWITR